MNVFLLPDGEDNIRQQLGIFHGRSPALFVVLAVQLIQRSLPFGAVLNQLDESVFLVVLVINLLIDGGKPLGSGHQCVFVDGHICVLLPTGLRTGDLSIQLLPDGIEAVHVLRS